jgi:hypothetical protein
MIPFEVVQALAGGAGGLVRALVGITKASTFNPKDFKFNLPYFAVTILVSIVVGQMAGLILNADWRMSMLAGYAGSDFLESMYKLTLAKFIQ